MERPAYDKFSQRVLPRIKILKTMLFPGLVFTSICLEHPLLGDVTGTGKKAQNQRIRRWPTTYNIEFVWHSVLLYFSLILVFIGIQNESAILQRKYISTMTVIQQYSPRLYSMGIAFWWMSALDCQPQIDSGTTFPMRLYAYIMHLSHVTMSAVQAYHGHYTYFCLVVY